MCSVTGTVYNVDGSVAANSDVIFRLVSTQTFGGDTVQTSPEVVQLSGAGVLPGGVQIPLGARVFIQVGRDKPVSVVAPLSGGSCPITFGALYGSALTSPPPATTIVTSIGAVNNTNGLVLSTTNPAGAGPATIALAPSGLTSWTPTLNGSVTNPTVTYTSQFGRYDQYGGVYFWTMFVGWSAFSGGSGNLLIGGFPLTQQNTTNFDVGGSSWNWGGLTLTANYTNVGCQLGPNGTVFSVIQSGTAGVANAALPVTAVGANGQILCQGWGSQ